MLVISMRTKWASLGAAALVLTGLPVAAAIASERFDDSRDAPLVEPVSADAPSEVTAVVTPQASEPVTLLTKRTTRNRKSARGDRFVEVSATGSNDVPEAALRAYKNAEAKLAVTRPGCQVPWTLVAAIGRVESDHGRYGGAQLGSDGVSRPAILGLPLNGKGVAAIHDTDNGRLDGDRRWDRAVGQMQFIPGTWAMVGADGDGDGKASPNDIDDAALATAIYLCHGGYGVADPSGMARAIYSYNHSDYYVALVMAYQKGYETGVFVIPSPPPPPGAGDGMPHRKRKRHHTHHSAPTPTHHHSTTKHHAPPPPTKPGAGTPAPTPSPSPPPTPTPTVQLTFDTGPITQCGSDFCLADRKLGLGPDAQLARQAAHDYDGDGNKESNADELAGLVTAGSGVRVGYDLVDGVAVVYVIGQEDYRHADGSFT